MLVLDASALVGWIMPDEQGIDLHDLASRHDDILAPWLLWAELRNILVVNERRGRLPAGSAEQITDAVDGLGSCWTPICQCRGFGSGAKAPVDRLRCSLSGTGTGRASPNATLVAGKVSRVCTRVRAGWP